jgi:hypothetical protein
MISSFSQKLQQDLMPISYGRWLLSTPLHATVYIFTQFAEYTSTDCKNEMALQQKIVLCFSILLQVSRSVSCPEKQSYVQHS